MLLIGLLLRGMPSKQGKKVLFVVVTLFGIIWHRHMIFDWKEKKLV